jgi:hypothetical protein
MLKVKKKEKSACMFNFMVVMLAFLLFAMLLNTFKIIAPANKNAPR